MRWITNSGWITKSVELMDRCNWLLATELEEVKTITMFWKTLKWKIPFQNKSKVSVVKPRLQTCQLGFLWRASVLWNSLPPILRNMNNLPKFKKKF